MELTVEALYEDGVFKPLKKVKIKEHDKVKLTIVKSRKTAAPQTQSKKKHPINNIINLIDSGIKDLSQNHDKYLY